MGPRLLTPLLAGGILSLAIWGSGGKMSAEAPDGPKGPKGKVGPGERGGPPGKGGPWGKGGPPGKAGHDLQKAYEVLSDLAGLLPQAKDQMPRETARLFDRAKEIYRAAHKSFADGDLARAGELGKAAEDAGRGLKHVLRASLPPAADLPPPPDGDDRPPFPPPPPREGRRAKGPPREGPDGPPPPPRPGPRAKGGPGAGEEEDAPPPPPRTGGREEDPPPPHRGRGPKGPPPADGDEPPPPPPPPPPDGAHGKAEPWRPALEALEHAKHRLDEAGDESGAGKAFLDGARHVYSRARQVYLDGDYRKSAELARGAEAWTHVGEHLQRAGFEGASLRTRPESAPPPPPPDVQREGRRQPPPPPGNDGPDGRRPGARPGRDSAPPPPPDGRRQPPPPPQEEDDPGGQPPPPPPEV